MTTTKPTENMRRVMLIARDAETGKSKSLTIYNAEPDQVIAAVKRALDAGESEGKHRRKQAISA